MGSFPRHMPCFVQGHTWHTHTHIHINTHTHTHSPHYLSLPLSCVGEHNSTADSFVKRLCCLACMLLLFYIVHRSSFILHDVYISDHCSHHDNDWFSYVAIFCAPRQAVFSRRWGALFDCPQSCTLFSCVNLLKTCLYKKIEEQKKEKKSIEMEKRDCSYLVGDSFLFPGAHEGGGDEGGQIPVSWSCNTVSIFPPQVYICGCAWKILWMLLWKTALQTEALWHTVGHRNRPQSRERTHIITRNCFKTDPRSAWIPHKQTWDLHLLAGSVFGDASLWETHCFSDQCVFTVM